MRYVILPQAIRVIPAQMNMLIALQRMWRSWLHRPRGDFRRQGVQIPHGQFPPYVGAAIIFWPSRSPHPSDYL